MVSQLAVQLKNDSIDRGADRLYDAMLRICNRKKQSQKSRINILGFLARGLESNVITPRTVRSLTSRIVEVLTQDLENPSIHTCISQLTRSADDELPAIKDELDAIISKLLARNTPATLSVATRLATGTYMRERGVSPQWISWHSSMIAKYGSTIMPNIVTAGDIINHLVLKNMVSLKEISDNVGNIAFLFDTPLVYPKEGAYWGPIATHAFRGLLKDGIATDVRLQEGITDLLSARISTLPEAIATENLTMLDTRIGLRSLLNRNAAKKELASHLQSPETYGSFAYLACAMCELEMEIYSNPEEINWFISLDDGERRLRTRNNIRVATEIYKSFGLNMIQNYIRSRYTAKPISLPALPTTSEWNSLLVSWATGEINLIRVSGSCYRNRIVAWIR
jgi:hypothetical protein